jgi:hypothetical protein
MFKDDVIGFYVQCSRAECMFGKEGKREWLQETMICRYLSKRQEKLASDSPLWNAYRSVILDVAAQLG